MGNPLFPPLSNAEKLQYEFMPVRLSETEPITHN